ncbi:hypothetical protein AN1V17_43800 [Vallitalea sediminicola]
MDCNKVQEMMSLYFDNELSKEERKLFEEHIVNCEQCKEELDFLQTMINNVNDVNEEKELPSDFHENLMAKIDSVNSTEIQTENRINRLNRFRKYYTAVAAVFVVVLVFGFIGIANINRMTDDDLQYDLNKESSIEENMDQDKRDEETKKAAPAKQIATIDHDNDINNDGFGTSEFQAIDDGKSISERTYETEEKSNDSTSYKGNIEPKNDIQGLTKNDNSQEKSNGKDIKQELKEEDIKEVAPDRQITTKDHDDETIKEYDLDTYEFQVTENENGITEDTYGDEEPNDAVKNNKLLDNGNQIEDVKLNEQEDNNKITLTSDRGEDTTAETESEDNKNNNERNKEWIVMITVIIILLIPLIYIRVEKNKLKK